MPVTKYQLKQINSITHTQIKILSNTVDRKIDFLINTQNPLLCRHDTVAEFNIKFNTEVKVPSKHRHLCTIIHQYRYKILSKNRWWCNKIDHQISTATSCQKRDAFCVLTSVSRDCLQINKSVKKILNLTKINRYYVPCEGVRRRAHAKLTLVIPHLRLWNPPYGAYSVRDMRARFGTAFFCSRFPTSLTTTSENLLCIPSSRCCIQRRRCCLLGASSCSYSGMVPRLSKGSSSSAITPSDLKPN